MSITDNLIVQICPNTESVFHAYLPIKYLVVDWISESTPGLPVGFKHTDISRDLILG